MEEAFIAQLLSFSGVTALVGTRVHLSVSTQDAACPRIVVHRIGGSTDYHTAGETNLREARMQVDCIATSGLVAVRVARAVKLAIRPAFVRNGLDFRATQIMERSSFYEEGTARLHRVSVDFRVWHTADPA